MPFFIPEYLNCINEQEYLQFIQEVQFKNPNLEKVEVLLSKYREKYYHTNYVGTLIPGKSNYNIDPLLVEISNIIADIFGFNAFQLIIDANPFPNAFTIPLSSKITKWNYSKCVIKNSSGLKFTQAANVNIVAVVNSSLIFNKEYTDREIVAVILHEIGHNFSDSINGNLGYFSIYKKVIFIPRAIEEIKKIKKIKSINNINKDDEISMLIQIFENLSIGTFLRTDIAEEKIATKFKNLSYSEKAIIEGFTALKTIFGFFECAMYNMVQIEQLLRPLSKLRDEISDIIGTYKTVLAFKQNTVNLIVRLVENFFIREDEYTSDAFAAMYGYGPDLVSGLNKLQNTPKSSVEKVLKSSKIGNIYYSVVVESISFIHSLIFEPHPSSALRYLNILNTLEQELNSGILNPKLKKETEKEIKEIKELLNDELYSDPLIHNILITLWNKFILSRLKGRGPKEKMIAEILNKIESFKEE